MYSEYTIYLRGDEVHLVYDPGYVSQECFLLHVVQTGSGVHPSSYQMGTGGFLLGGKAAGA
jgi:hypothetical protein